MVPGSSPGGPTNTEKGFNVFYVEPLFYLHHNLHHNLFAPVPIGIISDTMSIILKMGYKSEVTDELSTVIFSVNEKCFINVLFYKEELQICFSKIMVVQL